MAVKRRLSRREALSLTLTGAGAAALAACAPPAPQSAAAPPPPATPSPFPSLTPLPTALPATPTPARPTPVPTELPLPANSVQVKRVFAGLRLLVGEAAGVDPETLTMNSAVAATLAAAGRTDGPSRLRAALTAKYEFLDLPESDLLGLANLRDLLAVTLDAILTYAPGAYLAKGGEVLNAPNDPRFAGRATEAYTGTDKAGRPVNLNQTVRLQPGDLVDLSADIRRNYAFFREGPGYNAR